MNLRWQEERSRFRWAAARVGMMRGKTFKCLQKTVVLRPYLGHGVDAASRCAMRPARMRRISEPAIEGPSQRPDCTAPIGGTDETLTSKGLRPRRLQRSRGKNPGTLKSPGPH